MEFPRHKCGLYLTHNQHKDYYEKIQEYIEGKNGKLLKWHSEESKKKSIETDEIWELQWYPDTPISFYCVAAPTLEECLAVAKMVG